MWQVRFLPSLPFFLKIINKVMNIKSNKNDLKKLPGVDIILKEEKIEELVLLYGRELVTDVIREVINDARNSVLEGENVPGIDRFVAKVSAMVNAVTSL